MPTDFIAAATRRRYATAVAMPAAADAAHPWIVALDGKPLHTPGRLLLTLPSRALAEAMAAEWAAQGETIIPATLPLTILANTARERVMPALAEHRQLCADYAAADLLCYRAAEPPALAALQGQHWQPVLDWAAQRYDAPLMVTTGIMPVAQPETSLTALHRAITAYHPYALTALIDLAGAFGSLLLALALAECFIDYESALAAAELDETFQNRSWGEDDEAAARRRLIRHDSAQALRFLRLCAEEDSSTR